MHSGSFNFSFRLHWDDGQEDWLIRFPLPGKSMFADEKIPREAALMRYVAKHTRIPVPHVIASGTAAENPTGLGPFLIMTWIEGKKMSDVLRIDDPDGTNDVLDPGLDKDTLMYLYGEMAEILLELWKLDFDAIGSPSTHEEPSLLVDGRPLTLDMNESIRTCGLDDTLPNRTYHSSTDYISSLLQRQSTQLEQQRNSVYDSEDCRAKYTCRHLMKAVALHFISPKDDFGPFKLFCDDLCPGNVLVDDSLRVTGVIDWEFCYSAPAQFAGSTPWWLLLRRPHTMANDLDPEAFFATYLLKAEIFLQALEHKEAAVGMNAVDDRLSVRMRQSLQDRSAWFNMACRMGLSVDLIYWDLLDEFCWGPRSSITERVHNFTTSMEMHRGRESFVKSKIAQLQDYYAELGENTHVEYEEEVYQESSSEDDPVKKSLGSWLYPNASALGIFTLGVAACLLMKRYNN